LRLVGDRGVDALGIDVDAWSGWCSAKREWPRDECGFGLELVSLVGTK